MVYFIIYYKNTFVHILVPIHLCTYSLLMCISPHLSKGEISIHCWEKLIALDLEWGSASRKIGGLEAVNTITTALLIFYFDFNDKLLFFKLDSA